MNMLFKAAMVSVVIAAGGSSALAESKKASAPGQDRTCLVTTKNPGSFNDTDVADAKWLPRKAAEAQASKDPNTMRVFDYDQDPLVMNKTYASAEELCNKHFN
jgi:hypothetical protein